MPKRYENDATSNATAIETRQTIFGVPVLIVFLTLLFPVFPLVISVMGPATIDDLGMWFTGTAGLIWIGGFCVLVTLEVASNGYKISKYITAKR